MQVLSGGWRENIEVAGENALSRYDSEAYDQILLNARPNGINRDGQPKLRMYGVTYLRLADELLQKTNFDIFKTFVKKMHADQVTFIYVCSFMVSWQKIESHSLLLFLQDYCQDSEKYNHQLGPLERSRPKFSTEELLDATKPVEPFPWDEETDMSVTGGGGLLSYLIGKIFSLFK